MNTQDIIQTITASAVPGDATVDMNLEVVRIPVSDAERAKRFYQSLGWRLDADFYFSENERAMQVTPRGSETSIQFDIGAPGSIGGLMLVVSDIDAAREDLVARGVAVSEVFHRDGDDAQVPGPAPGHADYGSFAAFTDPDGNGWLLQEIKNRLPGPACYRRPLRRRRRARRGAAARRAAHGEHEARNGGEYDTEWPDWYARYMVAEQTGEELPA